MKLSPQKKAFHLSLGDRGEMVAWGHLLNKGYKILEKNYRCPLGEIDIVAEKNKRIFFIEVKTRASSQFGTPQESVHDAKQKKIIRVAEWFLKEKRWMDRAVSFEVIAIDWQMDQPAIRHIENAFSLESAHV